MIWDDFIYAFLLIISIFCAFISNHIDFSYKKYFITFVGLLFVLFVSGTAIWHSLLVTIISVLLICSGIQRFHIFVFVICFGYLIFFRTCHLVGFDRPPSYSNAVQLILTLKLVGAAFEIKDSLQRNKKLKILSASMPPNIEDLENLKLEIKYFNVKSNFIDLFTYCYCFVGLLTGPYFKFRVYQDSTNFSVNQCAKCFPEFFSRLRSALFIGFAYLIVSHFYYIEYVKTEEFYNRHFLYRFIFMTLMFFTFRMRMYFAWVISECVCMAAGIGGYPSSSAPVPGNGPTDLKAAERNENENDTISFETVRNLNISGCEWGPSIRIGMRSWNMSVQYWLAAFVYSRFPYKKYRTLLTMLVSAFWHGIHPGYYLSFMTVPLALKAEVALESILKISTTKINDNQTWDFWLLMDKSFFIRWFYKMRVFDYCCMGFLLLDANNTLRYWNSIWFFVHVLMILLIFVKFCLCNVYLKYYSYKCKNRNNLVS